MLDEIQARHAVHLPVEKDHIGIDFAQHGPGALAVGGFEDLDRAESLQNGDDELSHMLVVINHQDLQPVEPVPAHVADTNAEPGRF